MTTVIDLRQEEEVLKPHHRCMLSSANNSLSDHTYPGSSCSIARAVQVHRQFSSKIYTIIMQNDELISHSTVSVRSPCAAGNELASEIKEYYATQYIILRHLLL